MQIDDNEIYKGLREISGIQAGIVALNGRFDAQLIERNEWRRENGKRLGGMKETEEKHYDDLCLKLEQLRPNGWKKLLRKPASYIGGGSIIGLVLYRLAEAWIGVQHIHFPGE